MNDEYPVALSIDYPDRALNRLELRTADLRPDPDRHRARQHRRLQRPVGHEHGRASKHDRGRWHRPAVLPPLLMIVFRQKYPRWWFDWNQQLLRFANRVGAYLALMNDSYPSTDEEQTLHLDFAYPDARQELNRWLPLVKWFLAIPHYIALFFLFPEQSWW